MAAADPSAHRAGLKLAQLLAETQITAAPHLSQIDHAEKWRQTEDFLERLEQHTAGQVGPFLEKVLTAAEMPDELRHLLEEAIAPGAQFSAILEQIFLYGIVSNIIGTSVQPFLQGVSNALNTAAVSEGISRPVDPSNIATAAGRGLNLGDAPTVNVPDWAYTEAAKSGISKDDINLAASLIGLPPALQELFELLRRGVIGEDDVKRGLREGDFRDDWIDQVVALAHAWPTPLDFVRAAVQTQLDYGDAQTWASKTGLDTGTALPLKTDGTELTPDMFGLLVALAGRPPGPQELGRMALRGIIPWDGAGAGVTSFAQGIAESDVKTKWTDALRDLATYIPPPREVGTLLEKGAITSDQAVQYWQQQGVPAELAQGYEYMATQQHVGQDKLLAKAQITTGYFDGYFSHDQAVDLLGLVGYHGQVADDILALAAMRRELQAVNFVVSKVRTLYVAHKLSAVNAKDALLGAGIAEEQANDLLGIWEQIRTQPVRVPSEAQIGKAVKYGTLDQEEAMDALEVLGYQPRDAAIVLSAESETQVTPLPPPGTTVTG